MAEGTPQKPSYGWKTKLRRIMVKVRRSLPPGTRLPVGILLVIFGFLGFLPILGFWMIPLGVAIAMMDVKTIREWRERRRATRAARSAEPDDTPSTEP